jgi:drug/metabolite transporter (DMT)-like permease
MTVIRNSYKKMALEFIVDRGLVSMKYAIYRQLLSDIPEIASPMIFFHAIANNFLASRMFCVPNSALCIFYPATLMSDHLKGLLLAFTGVLVLSPDSLLIRLADIDQWALLVYRGVSMALGMALISNYLDPVPLPKQYLNIGRTGTLAALCFTGSTIGFINAVTYTTIANTLVIVATAPLFAALFGRLFLGERLKLNTFFAILSVLAGMLLVVGQADEGSHWIGNLCALVTAVCIAATFVLNRKNKGTNMVPAISISGGLVALVALPFANWVALDIDTIFIVGLIGLLVTIAFVLITVAARYIPAAEISLILPLETVGGIALAWWFLDEVPGNLTLWGALIILVALMVHSYFVLKKARTL